MNYTYKDFAGFLWHAMDPSDFTRFIYFAFLTQYSIINLGILRLAKKYTYGGEPITRNRFYIGYRRIIEVENMDDPDDLPKHPNIPQPVKNRTLNILKKYGKQPTWKLAIMIRKKLDLYPEEKWHDYIGFDIDHYLRVEKFKVIKKEI
jgi:hypothetical protein